MDAELLERLGVVQILLVDDSHSIREYAQDLLDQQHYEVQVAENGFEALCKLVALPPDIVFMDSAMPELDGFQSCALITACPQFAHIPVVLMSADGGPLERARADLAGAARLIGKPFRKRDLLDAVEALLAVAQEPNREVADALCARH
jgi:twitching motility two-component system response regulator PilG